MDSVLFDEKGEKWGSSDPRLQQHLLSSRDHRVLVRFAVENLGWIKLQISRRYVRVSCRPSFVSDQAFAALMLAVHEAGVAPIVLDVFDEVWTHQVIGDVRTFVCLLSSVISGRRRHQCLRADRMLSERDAAPAVDLAIPAALAQASSLHATNIGQLRVAFDSISHGRWYASKCNDATGHSVAVAIGSSFTPFNPAWRSSGEGNSLCSYADDAYGLWIAAHHRRVQQQREPYFDCVDAIVGFPSIGETRLRYRRVTVPLSLSRDESVILSAAITDSSINLRGML